MDGVSNLADRLERLPGLLTVPQLAALLGVHPQTVYKDVAANRIPYVRYRGVRFDPVYIAQWLRARTVR
jgi:excisionase family DNA binding protein